MKLLGSVTIFAAVGLLSRVVDLAPTIEPAVIINGSLLADGDAEWMDFKAKFKKHYDNSVQENFRRSVFEENKRKIEDHNKLYDNGTFTYKIRMNQFGDMLLEEYSKYMHADNKTISTVGRVFKGLKYESQNFSNLPDSIDWRGAGAVSPVKDQGLTCGACWAFSAVGALEGQYFRKTGELRSLSAQFLIDCTSLYGNLGCGGGSAPIVFQYVVDRKTSSFALPTESNYSYLGVTNACPYASAGSYGSDNHSDGVVNDSENVDENEEEEDDDDEETESSFYYVGAEDGVALKEAVAMIGPISAAIDGSHDAFRFYSEGIYYQSNCDPDDINHAILIVGYGTNPEGEDYWLVKNSWGEAWGEGGYFKIARNESNHCGIATSAVYPIV